MCDGCIHVKIYYLSYNESSVLWWAAQFEDNNHIDLNRIKIRTSIDLLYVKNWPPFPLSNA